jgi:hypothetical protein
MYRLCLSVSPADEQQKHCLETGVIPVLINVICSSKHDATLLQALRALSNIICFNTEAMLAAIDMKTHEKVVQLRDDPKVSNEVHTCCQAWLNQFCEIVVVLGLRVGGQSR